MGILIYAKLVSSNTNEAVYNISPDGNTWETITISEDDDLTSLTLFGRKVAAKCIRQRRESGQWPEHVTYAA